jgi:hypothetical protein
MNTSVNPQRISALKEQANVNLAGGVTVGPVIIRAVPRNRAFESRFQINFSVGECVAVKSAACVNMSNCCRSHGIKDGIRLGLS